MDARIIVKTTVSGPRNANVFEKPAGIIIKAALSAHKKWQKKVKTTVSALLNH